MTDPNEFLKAYELYEHTLAQANVLNKTSVFDALTAAGVTLVTVTFDGEGDSGQIENIHAHAGESETELPTPTVEFQKVAWNSPKVDASHLALPEAIETLCYDYLEQQYGGWENNDGAFGEFNFHVAERQIELAFNGRFSDFVHTDHTF